uniref:Uncharacterized protein n=1 Tax=Planktothrix agardhii TaxID=1160 RepID=A0A1J1JDF2_PLAAG|nr:protein of unknown function [Planktothrix agardhii]
MIYYVGTSPAQCQSYMLSLEAKKSYISITSPRCCVALFSLRE